MLYLDLHWGSKALPPAQQLTARLVRRDGPLRKGSLGRIPLFADAAELDLPSIEVAQRGERLAEYGKGHPEDAVANHLLCG